MDFKVIYETYVDMVYRICFTYMKNVPDTEDAVQEVFVKLLRHGLLFDNQEHVKAWLIVTASNHCKNMLKYWWRKRKNLEDYVEIIGDSQIVVDETMEMILNLPVKYKTVVYLYYYEGYNSTQIGEMLGKPPSTIRSDLRLARNILKKKMEEGL
ncbi:MAG: RNA polymerase sigma factor [Lachnospiraceae bacterium]|nr:RNA polymerase sigma factor [Lachnospiraceae bacterium]